MLGFFFNVLLWSFRGAVILLSNFEQEWALPMALTVGLGKSFPLGWAGTLGAGLIWVLLKPAKFGVTAYVGQKWTLPLHPQLNWIPVYLFNPYTYLNFQAVYTKQFCYKCTPAGIQNVVYWYTKSRGETKYFGIVIMYSLKREAKYSLKRGKALLQIIQKIGSEEVNKQHFNWKC